MLVRARKSKNQMEATDQVSTHVSESVGSILVRRGTSIMNTSSTRTHSFGMLKSHTYAEFSHREHSRYQPNLQFLARYRRYQLNLQLLPMYAVCSVSTVNVTVPAGYVIPAPLAILIQRSELGDRRLNVYLIGGTGMSRSCLCVILFVLFCGVFLGYHSQARPLVNMLVRTDDPPFLCLLTLITICFTCCQHEPMLSVGNEDRSI